MHRDWAMRMNDRHQEALLKGLTIGLLSVDTKFIVAFIVVGV